MTVLYNQADGLSKFGRGQHEEYFSEIILNLDMLFRRKCCFKYIIILFRALVALLFSTAEPIMHYGEHFCEITVNMDQWFKRRCCLK